MFGYVNRSTNGPKHSPGWKTQPFFSKKSVRSSSGRIVTGEDYYGWGSVRKECFSVSRAHGRHYLGRANIMSWPCTLWFHSKRASNLWGHCDTPKWYGLCWNQRKLPTRTSGKRKAERRSCWSHDIENHAKTCVERYCEHVSAMIQQFQKVATPCMDDINSEVENVSGRLVCSLLKNCPKLLVFGPALVDLRFYGLW